MSTISRIADAVNAQLGAIARDVIRRHLDLSDVRNRSFLDRPDGREQHQTQWHQWGILTHTRVFLRYFDEEIGGYLERWGLRAGVDAVLGERIDGAPKRDLLRIAILLHDIGKFGVRFPGKQRFHFTDHETLSGEVIRHEIDLHRCGLSDDQIEYIARTAEDHFVLGLVRKKIRARDIYGLEFVHTEEFDQLARQIKADHLDDFVEIGVLFLGDSLAKIDPATGPEAAVSQYDINIEVAHRYLEVVLED